MSKAGHEEGMGWKGRHPLDFKLLKKEKRKDALSLSLSLYIYIYIYIYIHIYIVVFLNIATKPICIYINKNRKTFSLFLNFPNDNTNLLGIGYFTP